MNNFWIILFHTYWSKLKTKSFIITTMVTLLLIIGLTNMQQIIETFDSGEDEVKVAVIDETGNLLDPLQQQLNTAGSSLKLEEFSGSAEDGEAKVKDGDYAGLLTLSADSGELPAAEYKSLSLADTSISGELEGALQQVKTGIAASKINLSEAELASLYEPVQFQRDALEENAKTEEELTQARGLVYVLLFIIYFAVIMYSSMIAMEVATEKSSRVMEILISSVSPIKQMFAKILGIALLSLTQLSVLLLVGYFFVKRNLESMQGGFFEFFGFGDIPAATIMYAVVFFILGYLLYATLAAFLGSLVSRIEDVQQMIMPMTMLVVAGFMIAIIGLSQPEKAFVTISSYIPFFTPMLMFMRVGMLTLPVWEPLAGIGILVVSILLLSIFGARVYKGGVLMYGKSNSFKDIKKALQLSKNK
ncbi:ABC transporter permease [Bacillus infantis]|uniref:ABC transporter permease n=1 Tax=Bacillus infantis TaxID=324767 RepID=UPI003CEE6894